MEHFLYTLMVHVNFYKYIITFCQFMFCIPGGAVSSGLGIYDTMQYIQPPVATWCVGQCCSMGSLLLASGANGMRYSLPNAKIMLHQPSGGFQVSNL